MTMILRAHPAPAMVLAPALRRVPAIATAVLAVLVSAPLAGCGRIAGDERAAADLAVGHGEGAGLVLDVVDGLGVVREVAPGRVTIHASAPAITIALSADATAGDTLHVTVENTLADAVLTSPTLAVDAPAPRTRPTTLVQDVAITPGEHTLVLAPTDDVPGPFRFVAFGDIQTALPTVDEVFAEIASITPPPRFVVFMGDLTERGELAEYELADEQLATLPVPFYPTLGNHELWADPARFRDRYGRSSYQFVYRDVAFTFVDSGDAGLDPTVEAELDDWLAAARDRMHVFLTHFPPIDPVGTRYGSFRSRRDAHRLLNKLASAGVDLTLYGHVHSFLSFENAGIPAFIAGGGGARPERWDGVGRHFLVVDLAPTGHPTVGLHRVYPEE
jgi:hypothetical protein